MLAVLCQTGDTAERDTCCETLAHCQYPSVYLAAKMVLVRKNKCSLQRPLKMDAGINRSYGLGLGVFCMCVCLFFQSSQTTLRLRLKDHHSKTSHHITTMLNPPPL